MRMNHICTYFFFHVSFFFFLFASFLVSTPAHLGFAWVPHMRILQQDASSCEIGAGATKAVSGRTGYPTSQLARANLLNTRKIPRGILRVLDAQNLLFCALPLVSVSSTSALRRQALDGAEEKERSR